MATNSKIEWTEATWNPVTGCTPVSTGCLNCYAARDAQRMAGHPNPKIGPKYKGLAVIRDGRAVFTGEIRLREDRLADPLHWRTPRRVFVNSQSDLFHEDVPFEFVDRVFAVMALCPQHTFQVLTKRPERMAEYMASRTAIDDSARFDRMPQWYHVASRMLDDGAASMPRGAWSRGHDNMPNPSEPLPNVWLLASAENQQTLDERLPHLLRCPAAVRGLSLEPLLGPINLTPKCPPEFQPHLRHDRISWVIAGGESGPNARPCYIFWIRSIREQCRAAGVACFIKQVGAKPVDTSMAKWPGETEPRWCDQVQLTDPKGGDMSEWPEDLCVREFPLVDDEPGDFTKENY